MTRITCQAIPCGDGITFIWSEGTASFEPYTLQGNKAARLRAAAVAAWEQLRTFSAGKADISTAMLTLAQAGHELQQAIFDGGGREIASWLVARRQQGPVELDIVSPSLTAVPWNVVYDSSSAFEGTDSRRAFWGCAFELTTTRRVNPLRQAPLIFQPRVLVAIDPALRDALPESDRKRLHDFIESKGLTVIDSVAVLSTELESQPPDIVYVFCRTDGNNLLLGKDSLSTLEFAQLLEANEDVLPVVILNTASATGSEMLHPGAVEQLRLAGLIVPTCPLSAAQANEIGLELLTGFVYDGQPLAKLLQSHRLSSPQAGLAISAFCPPGLRVAWSEEAAEDDTTEPPAGPLPDSPYRPLLPYEREDRALLAGREADVAQFGAALDDADARIVVLHAPSGAGKSSFLRAGVLPFLEDECVGYLTLRDRSDEEAAPSEKEYPALLVRPGPDLVGQWAEALSAFCAKPLSYSTPVGSTVAVDLPGILKSTIQGSGDTAIREGVGAPPPLPAGEIGPVELADALDHDASLLGRLLDAICERLPFELVIVVEQAEELITQARGPASRTARKRALAMLAAAVGLRPRCKFVFSIRTDFFGHLYDKLPTTLAGSLKDYLLPPLRQEQLTLALLLPTAGEPIPYATEIPLQKYGFQFEEGLAESIANDVQKAARQHQESALAILHATATALYELVKDRQDRVIRTADLRRIGGVENAFSKLVDQRIKRIGIPSAAQRGLRELFPVFFTKQTDGTVYRNLVPAKEVSDAWRGSTPIQEVVRAASTGGANLLEVDQLLTGGSEELYVGLTQDSLARLGIEWEGEKKRRAFASSRVADFLWIFIPAALLLVVITWAVTRRGSAGPSEASAPEDKKEIEKKIDDAIEAELNLLRMPLYTGQIQQAQRAWNEGNIVRMRQLLLSQQAHRPESDARGFEWYYLWRLANRQRHTLLGHAGTLTSVAMPPSGVLLASGSYDGTVKLWDPKTGEVRATLQTGSPVHSVAVASDAKSVAAGSADGTISMWAVKDAKDYLVVDKADKTLKGHKGIVAALALSPDNQTLVSGGEDQSVLMWDMKTGEARPALKGHAGPVRSVAFASNGKVLASGGADQQVLIWGADGKALHTIKTDIGEVQTVAFSPDGKTLAAGGARKELDLDAGVVRLWNVETGKDTGPTLRHGSEVASLVFLDEKTLASAGKDNAVKVWEIEKGRLGGAIRGHLGSIRAIAASGDGKLIASAGLDNTIKTWDTSIASEANALQAHKGGVNTLALLLGDRFAASGGADGVVRFWDLANGNLVHTLPAQSGTAFALAAGPDGKLLATATWNDKDEGDTKLWEVQADGAKLTAKELHVLKGHKKAITSFSFSPDGKSLATGSLDGTIMVWDTSTGKANGTLTGSEGPVRSVAFAVDGDSLISGGDDRKIRLWNTKLFHEVRIFSIVMDKDHKDVKKIDFPLEGHTGAVTHLIYLPLEIVSASRDGTIKLWTLQSGKDIGTMRGHAQGVQSIALAGKLLISGGADNVVRLWDPGQGYERFSFTDHTGPVCAVAATRDRTLILSGSADGTIRLWRAAPEPSTRKKE